MLSSNPSLLDEVREKFAHVDSCPFQGSRIFFENAGGALTLKSVAERSAEFAAIPDNQGRNNPAAHALVDLINKSKDDIKLFFNASNGQAFVGESGTELLFRLISVAALGSPDGGNMVGTTFEHPATRSASIRWAEVSGKEYRSVPHQAKEGLVTVEDYMKHVDAETRVATILHTSPVTGMGIDVASIVKAIRSISPDCFIIVDGIQHAAHGHIDIDSYDIDGYVISPYKVFSRHGYGVAWISERLEVLPHNMLIDAPATGWEMGTRDTGSYVTFSEVVSYLEWLGESFTDSNDRRDKIEAAGAAIHAHEKTLTNAMLFGTGNLKGLAEMPEVSVIGGADNPAREGLVSMTVAGIDSSDVVDKLNEAGIRTHLRKADHYSGKVLKPLGLETCIRVSMCHYNTEQEVAKFLTVMQEMTASI